MECDQNNEKDGSHPGALCSAARHRLARRRSPSRGQRVCQGKVSGRDKGAGNGGEHGGTEVVCQRSSGIVLTEQARTQRDGGCVLTEHRGTEVVC